MKNIQLPFMLTVCMLSSDCTSKKINLDKFPNTVISNETVSMKLYLPDPKKGLYRGTRFDWSGIIGSLQYKKHEYFGYWKDTHDPVYHEDLMGPVEGYIKPGLGYTEAQPGDGFIRIGVGIIEKINEPEYDWKATYKILDHGKWSIEEGKDWIAFRHSINSDFGYGYVYTKTIRLKTDGFSIYHQLQNTGKKTIETDQFNHNFFVIDRENTGPAFRLRYPFDLSSADDTKGLVELKAKELHFLQEFNNKSVFLEIEGFSEQVTDHQVTVLNQRSGAGVTLTVDKPLYRMAFWACETTLSPENFIWLEVEPGESEQWISDYTLFEIPSS